MELSPTYAAKFAEEITKLAIEHNMISVCSESDETAKEIVNFFNTVADGLSSADK